MYRQHCLGTIAPAMREDRDVFVRGAMFAVLSIRQPFYRVPEQMDAVFDGDTMSTPADPEGPLFGHKWHAYAKLTDDAFSTYLWRALKSLRTNGPAAKGAAETALCELCAVPGLGIVKSAFIAQLMGFDVACLDSRNIARDGRQPRAFRSDGEDRKARPAFRRKIGRYVADTFGKAEHYWDAWCEDVGPRYGMTAEEASALHLAIVPSKFVPF